MIRRVVLIGLIVVGLLAIGGYLGWSQGYTAGGAAEEDVVYHYAGGFVPFFFGLGLFFKMLFFVFLFLVISKLFFRGWGNHGRAYSGHQGRDWEDWHERHHRGHVAGDQPEAKEGDSNPPVA